MDSSKTDAAGNTKALNTETGKTDDTSDAAPPALVERTSDAPSETVEEDMNAAVSPPSTHHTGNPAVSQLQQVFSQTDEELLEAVLVAHGGSVEAATDSLLAMNDPTFVASDERNRLDADADYARALQMEDEERARRRRMQAQPQQQQQQERAPIDPASLTYQPYVPRRRQTGQATRQQHQQGENEPDELDQLTEQFSKFAEQGKRTFGTLFGKAREQVSRLNDTINQQVAQSQANVPTGGPPPPPPKPASERSSPQTWQYPSSLPRPTTEEPARESVVPERLPRPEALQRCSSTGSARQTSLSAPSVPGKSPNPAPPASTEPKKDFSKIGLLPRQSVSLLEQRDKDKKKDDNDSDEDDLEYVRSPFDDD